ncbi:MAG: hypothetical protein ICV63_15845 [Coleofasciculus sp. Co-bin14]|nr:hypothetical protein [Coleofasciculus sp. Co-bin14]
MAVNCPKAEGKPLPEYSQVKSPSALSRFLNENRWSTRRVIRTVRHQMLKRLLSYTTKGRRPWLQVIVDLTTLDKCGKFKMISVPFFRRPVLSVFQIARWFPARISSSAVLSSSELVQRGRNNTPVQVDSG